MVSQWGTLSRAKWERKAMGIDIKGLGICEAMAAPTIECPVAVMKGKYSSDCQG